MLFIACSTVSKMAADGPSAIIGLSNWPTKYSMTIIILEEAN